MATSSQAYLVVTGEYDDYRVQAVLAVRDEAQAFADEHNLRYPPRIATDVARIEPVAFYGPGWRPAPRDMAEVLDGEVVDVTEDPLQLPGTAGGTT